MDAAEEEKQARAAQQEMERDFQFKDIDEPTGPSALGPSVGFDDAAPFEGMFDEKQEDARLDQILSQGLDPDDPLLKVLQMAKEAVPRGAAAERLARHGVVGGDSSGHGSHCTRNQHEPRRPCIFAPFACTHS